MPETGAVHTEGDKESKKTPAPNGETQKKEWKAEKRRRVQKEERDQEQRRRDLGRERREAEESDRKTAEAARQATEALRRAAIPVEQPQEKPLGSEKPPEGRVFVKSERPLIALTREDVIKALVENGVMVPVPEDWEKMDFIKRAWWIDEHKLMPITKFPETAGLGPRAQLEPAEGEEEGRQGQREEVITAESLARALRESVAKGETEDQRQTLRETLLVNDYALDATSYVMNRLLWLKYLESPRVRGRRRRLESTARNEMQALEEHIRYVVLMARGDYGEEHYSFVDRFRKTIENLERRARDLGGVESRLLERVLSTPDRDSIRQRADQLDRGFQAKYDQMTTAAKNDLFGRFDEEAATLRKSIGNFIGSIRMVRAQLEPTIRETINREFPTQKGIAEWYTTKIIENLESQLIEESQLGVPNDWEDSMRHVLNNLRYAESFDSVQQIQIAIGNIDRIAAAIPVTTAIGKTPEETLRLREKAKNFQDEIVQLRDAVYVVLQLRETMTGTAMDPERVVELANSPLFKDITWKLYFSRFLKDHEQKDFEYVDRETGETKKYNLLDKAMQVYFRRFREEKRRMNAIEELTKKELDLNFKNLDYDRVKNDREQALEYWKDWDKKWLILKVLSLNDSNKFQGIFGKTFDDIIKVPFKPGDRTDPAWTDYTGEEIRGNVRKQIEDAFTKLVARPDIGAWLAAVNKDWSHTSGIYLKFYPQTAILDWFRNNTLLGTDFASVDNKETGRSLLGTQRQQLLAELEQKLRVEIGVPDEAVKRYRDAQLLTQVINNAYHVTWMWGAFSEYGGGIRIFNRDKVWYRDKDGKPVYQVGEFVRNYDSRLFNGVMDDWFNEYLITEHRGKAGGGRISKEDDVDYAFTRNMIGKRKGVLHHNRLLTKLINDNLRFGNFADDLVASKSKSFRDTFISKAKELENIDYLRVDWDRFKDEKDPGDTYDLAWGRGVAITEMIEDGEITLENVEWSRDVFTNTRTNINKFNMGDWWGDRASLHKFFSGGALQKYLQVPGTEEFYKLNTIENFYSTREIRIKPWYKLIIPAHFEIGKHWQKWFKLPYDMTVMEKEIIINDAVSANRIEAADHGWMKDKHVGVTLGRVPVPIVSPVTRWFRKYFELVDVAARETGKRAPVLFLLFLWEFFKAFFTQGQAQLAGK